MRWDKHKVETFLKLTGARVSAPVPAYMDYYLQRLSQTEDHRDILRQADQFLDDWDRFGDLNKIKHQMIEELIRQLTGRRAMEVLNDHPGLKVEKKAKTKKIGAVHKKTVVSIDMKAANYTVFRVLDQDLPESWMDFVYEVCASQNILCPDSVAASKKVRQVVFGSLNPKRTQKLQAVYMRGLADHFLKAVSFSCEVSLRSPDEINIVVNELSTEQRAEIQQLVADFKFSHELKCYNDLNWSPVKLSTEVMIAEQIPRIAGAFILRQLNKNGEVAGMKLFAVPRNLYMLTLAKTIGGIITDRDRYFTLDGRLALWAEDI